MDNKILDAVKSKWAKWCQNHHFQYFDNENILLVDWTEYYRAKGEQGDLKIHTEIPVVNEEGDEMVGISLKNSDRLPITFDLMSPNALPKKKSDGHKQCETIIYPKGCDCVSDWVLLMELKYAKSFETALDSERGYAEKMLEQIKGTNDFLRVNNVLCDDTVVYGIVAFPTLITDIYSGFLHGLYDTDNIFIEHKIVLKVTTSVNIVSRTHIDFV
ncbi:MAG: hypothetical protein R3Y50_09840 [Rikenellaceae bacterium]